MAKYANDNYSYLLAGILWYQKAEGATRETAGGTDEGKTHDYD